MRGKCPMSELRWRSLFTSVIRNSSGADNLRFPHFTLALHHYSILRYLKYLRLQRKEVSRNRDLRSHSRNELGTPACTESCTPLIYPYPPPPPFDLYWNEFHLLRRKVNARHILVSNAIAGLHVTWRRPCWRSRTKPFLFFRNKNLFSCKFFAKKILLFWPPTWPPCHVVANQELLVSNFFFYFGQKPPSATWVL